VGKITTGSVTKSSASSEVTRQESATDSHFENQRYGTSTRAVHSGATRMHALQPLSTPLYQTATFIFRDTKDVCDYHDSRVRGETQGRHEYGRYSNPTVDECESRLAALEQGEQALLFPSGMSAISTTLLALLTPGAHIIIGSDCYRKTRQLCLTTLARFGFTTTVVPMGDYQALERAIRPETKIILFESPTNPYLRVVDLKRLARIAKARGVLTFIDATFATPLNQLPLQFGIDLVTHAATKYISGQNNLLAGAVIGRKELIAKVRTERGILGAMPDPSVAGKILEQVKTLALRVAQHNQSALKIADFLAKHSAVARVWYPGHPSHPDYAVAKAQMKGFGGVVSFEIAGDIDTTAAFIDALRIPKIGPSFGGVDSLVEQPCYMSFYEYSSEQRAEFGMKDNLVRYAVGIEDAEDLLADLAQALAQISTETRPRRQLDQVLGREQVQYQIS
jgi:cystathionine gamma-synthase